MTKKSPKQGPKINPLLEKVFFKYGQFVALHPIPVIVGSLLFAGLCGIRLYFEWASETDQVNLWVPTDSDYYRNQKWLSDNFPSSFRLSTIIIKAMVYTFMLPGPVGKYVITIIIL